MGSCMIKSITVESQGVDVISAEYEARLYYSIRVLYRRYRIIVSSVNVG
jgi:hypothetical protein